MRASTTMLRPGRWCAVAILTLGGAALLWAADPTPEDVKKALKDEPITAETWKSAWKDRFKEWSTKDMDVVGPAFVEGMKFLETSTDKPGGFKAPPKGGTDYRKDSVAHLVMGIGTLIDPRPGKSKALRGEDASKWLEVTLKMDNRLAAAHYYWGLAVRQQELADEKDGGKGKARADGRRLGAALDHFDEARKLEPGMKMLSAHDEGEMALLAKSPRAEALLERAMKEKPDAAVARDLAQLYNAKKAKPDQLKALADQFPKDGALAARLGLAYAQDNDRKSAVAWFKKATDLGTDPATVLDPKEVARITDDLRKEEDKARKEEEKAKEKEREEKARSLHDSIKASIRAGFSGTPDRAPNKTALAKLLKDEPIGFDNWVVWRKRLHDWCGSDFNGTKDAFVAAADFLKPLTVNGGKDLKQPLDNDPVAYLVLSLVALDQLDRTPAKVAALDNIHHQMDRLLKGHPFGLADAAQPTGPQLALAHALMGQALFQKEKSNAAAKAGVNADQVGHAFEEFDEARKQAGEVHIPFLPSVEDVGRMSAEMVNLAPQGDHRNKLAQMATERMKPLLRADPKDEKLARSYAAVATIHIPQDPFRKGPNPGVEAVKPLLERFPDCGELHARYAYALQLDGHYQDAVAQLDKAESLQTDGKPTNLRQYMTQDVIDHIRREAERQKPVNWENIWSGPLRWFAYAAAAVAAFTLFYASVIFWMAVIGLFLAMYTRGPKAADLLGTPSDELVAAGQVVRTNHETWLTRVYCLALMSALVLFYFAVPFLIWGLVFVFLFVMILAFFLRRDYSGSQMHDAMVKASGGSIWAIFRALFSGFSRGSFGLKKDEEDCPKLFQVLREVAERVDTDPVDEVYIAPGASIGVHQEGRGPFGMFGARKRVLTLGLSTMHFLTVNELKAILAHEYAHFSHQDTFYSRFIYQVTLTIRKAMEGMAQTGGFFNYLNPFYWFFFLYHKSYALLCSGFSRSREFLADRMACSLYGSDVFAKALEKVCTDGTLFEMTVYQNIVEKLKAKQAYVNMYLAFRKWRDESLTKKERDKLYKKLLADDASLFDSHPTFKERIEAMKALPKARKTDTLSALQLFEEPEEIEKELTDFLTEILDYIRRNRR